MNRYHGLALMSFIGAVVCLALSIAEGEGAVHIFLVFPVISINGVYSGAGALLLFAAVFLFFFGFTEGFEMIGPDDYDEWDRRRRAVPSSSGGPNAKPPARVKSDVQSSGVILIGPLPIVWGGSSRQAILMMVLALIVMAVAFLMLYYGT